MKKLPHKTLRVLVVPVASRSKPTTNPTSCIVITTLNSNTKTISNRIAERSEKQAILDTRLLYYLIRKFKMWLNINHITVYYILYYVM